MGYREIRKKIIVVLLIFAMVLPMGEYWSDTCKAADRYDSAASIEQDAAYALVMSSITPSGLSSGEYVLKNTQAEAGVMVFESFDSNAAVSDTACLWSFETMGSGYAVKLKGENDEAKAYLNISSAGALMGARQEIRVTASDEPLPTKDPAPAAAATPEVLATPTPKPTQVPNDENNEYSPTYIEETGELPAFTIGCMTDIHIDYGIQNQDAPIRPSTVKAAEQIKKDEKVDLMICGGDVTSNNAWAGWTPEKYNKSIGLISEALNGASVTGKTLYVSGNHEFVAGGDKWNSGDYSQLMRESVGELDSSEYLSQDDDSDAAVAALTRNNTNISMMLAYHYVIEGIDFIGINTPYSGGDNHGEYVYTASTMEWVSNKLDELGKDKLVFIVSHYPLKDARNVKKYMAEPYNTVLKEALLPYENAVLLYGHDHGAAYIDTDTYERVTPYASDGSVMNDRPESNDSFVSSFMGSMGYYSNLYNPDLLDFDPMVVQALMIYVYSDRITFQMKNYGETTGTSKAPLSYTIMKSTGLQPKLPATPEPTVSPEPAATAVPAVTPDPGTVNPTAAPVQPATRASANQLGTVSDAAGKLQGSNAVPGGDVSQTPVIKLKKPSMVKAVRLGKNKLKITWKKVAKADGYKLFRSAKKGSTGKCIAVIKGSKKLQYTDKKVKSKKTYYYCIKAYIDTSGKREYGKASAAKKIRA